MCLREGGDIPSLTSSPVNWSLENSLKFVQVGGLPSFHLRESAHVELERLVVLAFDLQFGLKLFHQDFEP